MVLCFLSGKNEVAIKERFFGREFVYSTNLKKMKCSIVLGHDLS